MTKKQKIVNKISKTLNTKVETIEKYINQFKNKYIVIKYGGHAMGNEKLYASFTQDISLLDKLGLKPVIVHGGGPQIGAMLNKLNIESKFIGGLRVTNKETINIVEMVLSGSINKDIVNKINKTESSAIGLSGKDGRMILAKKVKNIIKDKNSNIEKKPDIGFVGEPININPLIITQISNNGIIPIIAPVGFGDKGETFNINADTAAGHIASALKAERILLLTDVEGVLDSDNKLISKISTNTAKKMIKDNIITGGMIPKINTCLQTVQSGVKAAVIIDGRKEHAILREIFTKGGYGTMIN
tara:strand:- start:36254 stop:37156 length:903 start_codon:yes stop_codon:yes gene_type:complete